MAKFVYKMQNILDIKLKLEAQEKTAFAVAVQKLRDEEVKLKELQDKRQDYEKSIKEKSLGNISVMELKRLNEGVSYIKEQEKKQSGRIRLAERDVELARAKLNKVMIERKTQETLREKAFDQFVHEINEDEKKEIDQLTSFSYNNTESR